MAIVLDRTYWIYPPAWNESTPDGTSGPYSAASGHRRAIYHVSHYWDATEDFSEQGLGRLETLEGLYGADGKPVTRLVIEKIEYNGFGVNIQLFWNRANETDVTPEICVIGATAEQFEGCKKGPFVDPGNGDGTDTKPGGILMTSVDGASKDYIDMTFYLKFKTNAAPNRRFNRTEIRGAGTMDNTRNTEWGGFPANYVRSG